MFQLSKWYLDLVDPDGVAVICYIARLRWGPVRIRYASILLDVPGAPPEEAVTLRRVERPAIRDGVLDWRSDALDVDGVWHRRQPAIRETLHRGPGGAIRWSCRMPLAAGAVRWGPRRFAGPGYVESLTMTIPPSRLPFRSLRWGRHLSQAHSLVWIDWSGDAPARWVWLDGARQRGALFCVDGVTGLDGGGRLETCASRDIRNRLVLPAIARLIPGIGARGADSLASMHEHKMVARSRLYDGETLLDDGGWTVHEVVTL